MPLQTSVGKSCLTAHFLPQPPTSQNWPLTIKLIENPACIISLKYSPTSNPSEAKAINFSLLFAICYTELHIMVLALCQEQKN